MGFCKPNLHSVFKSKPVRGGGGGVSLSLFVKCSGNVPDLLNDSQCCGEVGLHLSLAIEMENKVPFNKYAQKEIMFVFVVDLAFASIFIDLVDFKLKVEIIIFLLRIICLITIIPFPPSTILLNRSQSWFLEEITLGRAQQ